MFCKECGKIIDDDSKFCSYCGTKQSAQSLSDITEVQSTASKKSSQTVNINLAFGRPKPDNEKNITEQVKIEKYDLSYKKETEATMAGIFISVVFLFLYFSIGPDDVEDAQSLAAILSLVSLILRIFITIWIVNIAKRQNRDTIGWGIFGFLIPVLALIIVGFLKKLNKPHETYNAVNQNESVHSTQDKKDNDFNTLKIGSCGFITYPRENSVEIKYKVTTVENHNSFWSENRTDYLITFSDGKIGKLCSSKNIDKYYFKYGYWRNYYKNIETVINALHYYLCYNKLLEEGKVMQA